MSELNFPIPYRYEKPIAGDYVPKTLKLDDLGNLYNYAQNPYFINVGVDTTGVLKSTKLFYYCNSMRTVKSLNMPNVTDATEMFYYCSAVTHISRLELPNLNKAVNMFSNCQKLLEGPDMDLHNATSVAGMFYYCSALKVVPEYDLSNATDITQLFYNCGTLRTVGNLNCKKATSLNNVFYGCSKLRKIGVIECDSINSPGNWMGYSAMNNMTELGGFRNLGKYQSMSSSACTGNYFLYVCPNLTKESILNVLNELYDRASAGYSTVGLKLHTNHLDKLTDEEKAIATNKGWTLS